MLPPLKSLRFVSELHCRIDDFFSENVSDKTDFEIYLKEYKVNLQREYCWNDLQKQELINSILLNRHIPPITIVEYLANYYKEDRMNHNLSSEAFFKAKKQIIDGKQRLLTHKMFIDNLFSLDINGVRYYFKDLPDAYKSRILYHQYSGRVIKYDYYGDATDDQLIELFEWCNFAGTQQEKDYMLRFKKQNK